METSTNKNHITVGLTYNLQVPETWYLTLTTSIYKLCPLCKEIEETSGSYSSLEFQIHNWIMPAITRVLCVGMVRFVGVIWFVFHILYLLELHDNTCIALANLWWNNATIGLKIGSLLIWLWFLKAWVCWFLKWIHKVLPIVFSFECREVIVLENVVQPL